MTDPDEGFPSDRVLVAIGMELMRINRRSTRVYPGAVLDLSVFKILWLLTETGPTSMKGLASELLLDQSTVSRQVKTAVEQGLIERYAAPDSSAWLLRATPLGSTTYQHEAELRTSVVREALGTFGVDRAAEFVEDLAAFNDAFDEAYARVQTAD